MYILGFVKMSSMNLIDWLIDIENKFMCVFMA